MKNLLLSIFFALLLVTCATKEAKEGKKKACCTSKSEIDACCSNISKSDTILKGDTIAINEIDHHTIIE